MEPGPHQDKQKMECRARYDIKGEKNRMSVSLAAVFPNDTFG